MGPGLCGSRARGCLSGEAAPTIRHVTPPPLSLHAWLRYDAILRQLQRASGVLSVLELGAGQGAVGMLLARRFDYLGLEPDRTSFTTAQARFERTQLGEILASDLSALPPGRTFDLVCAFEVLEHLEDDASAVAEWIGRITPGGWLLVSVPAGRHRFGAADEKAGHFRRYDRGEVSSLLAAAGLVDATEIAYGFPAGYVLEAGRNVLARRFTRAGAGSMSDRTAASGRWLQPPDWAAPALWAAGLPLRALQRPFARSRLGTGFVVLARRP